MKPVPNSSGQCGAALIVSLILLIVLTLLGLSSVRTVAQEERMTANAYDRSIGLQGAEAALRAGEAIAQAQADLAPPNTGFDNGGVNVDSSDACVASPCQNGLCSEPDKDCTERWRVNYLCQEADKSDCGPWTDAAGLSLGSLAETPQYFVEYLGGNFPCNIDAPATGAQSCKRYRITARSGSGASGRSTVILQSIYATE